MTAEHVRIADSNSDHRLDIQALRGVAVLVVLGFHAKVQGFELGYLGVDVFFVVSGFLITGLIAKQIGDGSFCFKQFYLRRAWRLLPAAYATLVFCCLMAPFLLTYGARQEFTQQLWGALSFTSNIVLWNQTGYFQLAADSKALLHTWSLSIEEQYYLLVPLLLFLLPKNRWMSWAIGITTISLVSYLFVVESKPNASFFLTPFRVWELGAGSILALAYKKAIPNSSTLLALFSFSTLLLSLIVPLPGGSAAQTNTLLAVISTMGLLWSQASLRNWQRLFSPLLACGTISYSLYLIHWPLLAFLNSANVSGASSPWWLLRVAALVLSFLLAVLMFKFVEQPFRLKSSSEKRSAWPLLAITVLIVLLGLQLKSIDSDQQHEPIGLPNYGLSKNCNTPNFSSLPECQTADSPKVLLWGDSYAMHIASALTSSNVPGLVQSTDASCVPLIGYNFFNPPQYGKDWVSNCVERNQATLSYALQTPELDLVVIASLWHIVSAKRVLSDEGQIISEASEQLNERLRGSIEQTVVTLRNAGKRVVLVAPPPSNGFNIGQCHQRRLSELVMLHDYDSCSLDRGRFEQKRSRTKPFFSDLEKAGITVFNYDELLCNDEECLSQLDDVVLYRDAGHFSVDGSAKLGVKYDFYSLLDRVAN